MDREATLTGIESPWTLQSTRGSTPQPTLVVAWSAAQPERVGEVCFVPSDGSLRLVGRGRALDDDEAPRVSFGAQRPGVVRNGPELLGPQISRRQALLRLADGGIRVERVGACGMTINGAWCDTGLVRPGDTLALVDQLVLLCVERPAVIARTASLSAGLHGPFGQIDELGLVGESPLIWKLRDELAFVARSAGHVMILGASGVGKEVAARAIHQLSSRSGASFVARSAATIPESLIDAELFGNVGNYPNPGMRDRPGLIGEANGSTLFLDEIGELPQPMQARLLRVLDSDGEYSRLGEARSRRADFRLIAATNRTTDELKPDFAARFTLRVSIVGLNERREDIPLLIRHLLRRAALANADIAFRYYDPDDTRFENPRIAPQLVERLVRHTYRLHVRELDTLLWRAMLTSPDDFIGLTDEVEEELELHGDDDSTPPTEIALDDIKSALERHRGNVTRAARELGLKNRYVLYRLMRKFEFKV